ncbi:MAG: 2-oxoglutarate dehydrogenase complex dihydrolipoyllysine-residue succinyltransferase [Duodenibacillus sp.]
MSIVTVKVPQLSESVSQATLLEWKKPQGSAVAQDEILVEIETDKVVLEVPAPCAGVLTSIHRPNGATVTADEVIAEMDPDAVAVQSPAPAPAPADATPACVLPTAAVIEPRVMPSAALALAEHGIKAETVSGTGPGDRITKEDVLKAVEARAVAAAPAPVPEKKVAPKSASKPTPAPRAFAAPAVTGARTERREPMSRIRARMAERLLESLQTSAQLTTFNECDMSAVIALRSRYKESFEKSYGVKLGFMSFFVKAAAYALKRHPILNASIEGNDIVWHDYIDIGVAVGTERGLVVPVVRDADRKSFAAIEAEIADFARRAREGKLTLDELSGGTFTITNGGVFGSMLSTPIVNPPQSAILGVHNTKERAVVVDGQIVVRPMTYLAMSYDHRLIDGREAVTGLVSMKQALEDPARILLEI